MLLNACTKGRCRVGFKFGSFRYGLSFARRLVVHEHLPGPALQDCSLFNRKRKPAVLPTPPGATYCNLPIADYDDTTASALHQSGESPDDGTLCHNPPCTPIGRPGAFRGTSQSATAFLAACVHHKYQFVASGKTCGNLCSSPSLRLHSTQSNRWQVLH